MQYDTLATKAQIENTMESLKERGHVPEYVETKEAALARIKELIPEGASVMNGASRSLEEIGFVDLLKEGTHGWRNLHELVFAEKDPVKQAQLRKESTMADFYLGSVHAVAETGEIVIASNSGSQLPNIVFNSPNLIFVVGAQKITPSLEEAHGRLHKHVVPLEDERALKAYGVHTNISKLLTIFKEQPYMGRKSHVIIVNEKFGF